MDNIRQKSWFSITAYVVSSLSILTVLFIFAEIYFPSQSSEFIPRNPDRITRWLFHPSARRISQMNAAAEINAQQQKLFFQLNKKMSVGKAELIYRGLVGSSEFKIDVIIPELDPHISYPYRINISKAKDSFRLAKQNYRLVYAKQTAIQLKQIK